MTAPPLCTLDVEWRRPFLETAHRPDFDAEAARANGGSVPAVLGYLTPCPWGARLFLDSLALRFSFADSSALSLIGLIASHENACRYCYGHRRALLRIQGYSSAQIDRLGHELDLAELSGPAREALAFVRALARSRPRPARQRAEQLVSGGMQPQAVAELVGETANWCLGNRVSTMLAVPAEEKLEAMPDSLLGKLLRPLMARSIRKGYAHVPPPPRMSMQTTPFGRILEPLADTHVGQMFARGLVGAFESAVLPRRTKALMFAVVARRMDCAITEPAARELLTTDGLDDRAITAALEHLSSPVDDPAEVALLAFARDSVRYRPVDIQDHAKTLAEQLGSVSLVEAAGVAALANAVVRIAMLQA